MSNPVHYHYNKFPPKKLDWERLIPLVGPANAELARYDGILNAVPNASVLLSPLTTQEAVLSSRIEGTQATMGEVLKFEAEGESKKITKDRMADIDEILNYRQAMNHAVSLLSDLPLCQRLIKETHSVLLKGVRGEGKSPGEYRKIQNWIGPPGCKEDEAKFIPIIASQIPEAMSKWEKYIHSEASDHLIKLAIVHAEFEAIHPFLDGNGRLGRMCVPLFMYKMGLIHTPMFYISAYFEANRNEYYERLLAISREDDWSGWCGFFLDAIIQQARENQEKASSILSLYEDKKKAIVDLARSQYSVHALDFIFSKPIFQSTEFTHISKIPKPTANRILAVLRDNGICEILRRSSGRRPAIYVFPELINITEGKKIF